MEAAGKTANKVVQEALKKYFHLENRAAAVEEVIGSAFMIGKSDGKVNAVLNRDKPAAYIIPAETYEKMMREKEDGSPNNG